MRHARNTHFYQVQRCLAKAKPKNLVDFGKQTLLAAQLKKPNEFLAHPPRTDRCNEFKKWIKPLSTINSEESETTGILQNSCKLKLLDSRTRKDYNSQIILHPELLQILIQFPRITIEKFFKNYKVDLHTNKCLHQSLRNGATFLGMCSNKYLKHLLVTSSGAQHSYHHAESVRHFSTSSSSVTKPHSNIFPDMGKALVEIFRAEDYFNYKKNKYLLNLLLNSIVFPEHHQRNIQFSNLYNYTQVSGAISVKATDNRGETYDIEIKIIDDFDYQKKPLEFWSGPSNEQLRKTIIIHILGFTYLPEIESYHNTFVVNEKDGQIELHIIELEKFHDNDKGGLQELIKKIKTPLDKWLALFTAGLLLDKDNLPEELSDKYIKRALDDLYCFYLYSDIRISPKKYLKWLRDDWGMGRTRERLKYISGYLIFSMDQLWVEQEDAELEQMRIDDTAKLMLKYDVPIDEIKKVCYLTREEIISLKKEISGHTKSI